MTQPETVIRIVDDDESMRNSLAFMFRQEGYRTAVYPGAKEFLSADMPGVPGCLVLDVRMEGMSGLELQNEMIRRGLTLPIVFFSGHGTIGMAVDTMQKGASAFVEKTDDRGRLIEAVHRALRSQAGPVSDPGRLIAAWNTLTPREKDVAELLAKGLLNRQVAERLGIAPKTVQVFRGEVCRKLGVRGAAAIAQAVGDVAHILGTDRDSGDEK
ncbi:MAG: DNA-binding response regulator [Burkholderia sp.]|jgi:two-component system, LuxR family, response regulator TtrR